VIIMPSVSVVICFQVVGAYLNPLSMFRAKYGFGLDASPCTALFLLPLPSPGSYHSRLKENISNIQMTEPHA